jgi:hypothetical protein
MSESVPHKILVVANRTAATPTLLEAVRTKAGERPTDVTLLVPAFPTVFDPEALESRHSIELAVPLLAEAVGGKVNAILGDPEAFTAVRQALRETSYDGSPSPRCPRGCLAGSSATSRGGSSSSASP